jgi:hypothetical protein
MANIDETRGQVDQIQWLQQSFISLSKVLILTSLVYASDSPNIFIGVNGAYWFLAGLVKRRHRWDIRLHPSLCHL